MTDEEMLAEAKQVGAITAAWIVHFSMDELREFARRIAEIEREECAKEAEHWQLISTPVHKCGDYIAAAIRARGKK